MRYEMFDYPYTLIESTDGLEVTDLKGSVIVELSNHIDHYRNEYGMIDEDTIICEVELKIEIKHFVLEY